MATDRARSKATPREPEASAEPPYYIATQALYIGAARAHAAGARVLPEHVARHGWQDKVRHPEDPDEPAAQPPTPTVEPATDQGQAPATSKEGE